MDLGIVLTLAVLVLGICILLPIIAILRTGRIRHLEARLAGVEAALLRVMRQQAGPVAQAEAPAPVPTSEAAVATPPASAAPPPAVEPEPAMARDAGHLESVIGQKWIGWVAIVLIFCAAAFFLKYAFENRWIGELGRVTLGVAAGLLFAWGGLERHRKGWRYLAEVLTGGGVTILYLSVYGAFGYYHLIDQRTAFVFLAIIVAEAHLLALAYNGRGIAVMALVGGLLVPLLLSTGRDQYRVLFTYLGLLDAGVLGVVIARRWRWIGSLAYIGTQALFWSWYQEHYHPEKRLAALLFQTGILLLFLLADLAPRRGGRAAGWEEWIRLAVNPFVFYGTCYSLLNGDHHEWMAALALGLAAVYAALARAELSARAMDRRLLLATVGTALTFVTLAIPIQLESNWITIGWGLEGLALVWAGFETGSATLRRTSAIVFTLAVVRNIFVDTPWRYRAPFTPVFNKFFLGMLALTVCLGAAAYLHRRLGPARGSSARAFLAVGLLAMAVFWIGSSVEAYSYFDAQATHLRPRTVPDPFETARQLRWSGQLALSVLWSVYAGLMTAAGFRMQIRALRAAGLVLFGITLLKVVFLDISELRQFYRIVALLALGLVLLGVAWAYQRRLRREQAR